MNEVQPNICKDDHIIMSYLLPVGKLKLKLNIREPYSFPHDLKISRIDVSILNGSDNMSCSVGNRLTVMNRPS